MKFKRWINALLTTLCLMIVGWLSFLRPDWLLWVGFFTCISGYFLLLISFMPLGKLKLEAKNTLVDNDAPPFWGKWLWQVVAGQLALVVLTIAVITAFFGEGPNYIEGKIPIETVILAIKGYTWQWGLFPWGVYGLWGLIVGYVAYIQKGSPHLYQIAGGLLPKRLEPMMKTFIEGTSNAANFLVIGLSITAIILLWSYGFESLLKTNHFDAPFILIFILSFLPFLFSFRSGRRLFLRLSKVNTLNRLYIATILILVPLIVLASIANNAFMTHYAEMYQKWICHQCGNYFANVPLETRLAAIYWGWWLGWTPLAGSYLAKISQGRTIREFVLGVMFVPLILILIISLWGSAPFLWVVDKISLLGNAWMLFLWAGLSWLILSRIIVDCKNSALFVTGYMETDEKLPRDRLSVNHGSKIIGLSKLSNRLLMMILGTLFLHTAAGWYGIQFQLTAMGVYVINAVYLGFDFLCVRFYQKR